MPRSEIDAFIRSQPAPWPQERLAHIVEEIRRRGSLDESIKWGNPFFAVNNRSVVKLFVARDWINVFFYRGAELTDTDHLLASEGRSAMRRIRVQPDASAALDTSIGDLTRQAIALERQ